MADCCYHQKCQPGDCQPIYDNRTGSLLGFAALLKFDLEDNAGQPNQAAVSAASEDADLAVAASESAYAIYRAAADAEGQ